MSKDMLGSVIRAAVSVPQSRLETLAKIASKLARDNPEGDAWHTHLCGVLESGLADSGLQNRASDTFPISVDYNRSLADMIKAGKYDWTSGDITEKWFPLTASGLVKRTLVFCHFNRVMRSEQVLESLENDDMEPATIEDLLAFGSQYPEEQRKYPIICLGSATKVHGDHYVPFLDGNDARRGLYLGCSDPRWNARCRFLARKKTLGHRT